MSTLLFIGLMGQSGTMHLDSVYCAKTDLGFFAFS